MDAQVFSVFILRPFNRSLKEQPFVTSLLGYNDRRGNDEHRGRGYKGQRKVTGNACKALSHSHLFWPVIMVVTFAAIWCISPR